MEHPASFKKDRKRVPAPEKWGKREKRVGTSISFPSRGGEAKSRKNAKSDKMQEINVMVGHSSLCPPGRKGKKKRGRDRAGQKKRNGAGLSLTQQKKGGGGGKKQREVIARKEKPVFPRRICPTIAALGFKSRGEGGEKKKEGGGEFETEGRERFAERKKKRTRGLPCRPAVIFLEEKGEREKEGELPLACSRPWDKGRKRSRNG